MTTVSGEYFDGKTSARHYASLEQDHGVFKLTWENGEQRIHISNLTFSSRLSNVPRSIRLNTGELFLTNDNEGVDELLRSNGEDLTLTLAHKLESFVPMVVISWLGVVAIAVWFYTFALPDIVATAAQATPPEWEEKFAENVLEQIETQGLFHTPDWTADEKQEAERVIHMLEGYALDSSLRSVRIMDSDFFRANALALPGGHIFLTRELIELVESDEQLVAIFLHELGHVTEQHALRMTLQNSILALVIVAVTGDVTSTTDLVVTLPSLLLTLNYSRDFETGADQYAIDRMRELGIDRSHLARALELLSQQSDGSGYSSSKYLSTHPITADRIANIQRGE